jgi:Asp-tRNA(Asn)/Glu-tRNA(Gln) amidotransferase A subunit family amidase
MSAIVERSARELRDLIRAKDLSPVELFDACVARIEAVNPAINAVVAMDLERGRATAVEAEQAVMRGDALGRLHGLPVGVKDLNPTAGLRTTWGSLVYKDHVPTADDLMCSRIRAAGGIILAKTNTPEFGAGANTVNRLYGATVNPFDTTRSAAGSSGGSAAALATDMLPLATGSDLGGSLRTPASFCGIVGHRPSPGAVPDDAARDGWSPLAVDGPMGRTVADAALLLSATVGRSGLHPIALDLSPDAFDPLPPIDLSPLRVAFSEDLGAVPVDPGIRASFRAAAARIAPLFASTQWGSPDFGDVNHTFEALRAVAYLHAYGPYVRDHRKLAGPNVIANVELASGFALAEVGQAQAAQTALFRRMQAFYRDVDLLICPAAPVPPYPVEEIYPAEIEGVRMENYVRWFAINSAITLTTHPATVIPCGLGPTGLPFGIQIVGRYRDDVGTLAAAAAIEAALASDPAFARPRPDIARLSTPGIETRAGRIPAVWEAHAAS